MKAEVSKLKELKAELAELYAQQAEQNTVREEAVKTPEPDPMHPDLTAMDDENFEARRMIQDVISNERPLHTLSLVLSLTELYLSSPLRSALIR
jgi:hypothetical protein